MAGPRSVRRTDAVPSSPVVTVAPPPVIATSPAGAGVLWPGLPTALRYSVAVTANATPGATVAGAASVIAKTLGA